tara:strand:+ start:1849 stop:2403 length:555 start_codon:yes stop_codon:yes gene_type:complete
MNRDFTLIPDNLWTLGSEEAKLISVIKSWSKNNKEHFMSQEEYCKRYSSNIRTYCRVLKKLKDNQIIEVVRRLPNNRQVLVINEDQLDFVLDKGYTATKSVPPCQPVSTTLPESQYVTDTEAVLDCHIGTTHIQDKVQDKGTIKDTIKGTKPEEFSFDIFKEEVKPDDIDLKLAALALDFDNDY